MKFKSHFTFSKQQRNGIFLLVFVIILLQCVYFYLDKPSPEFQIDEAELLKFRNEIDSLKKVKIEKVKPKIYPFNPNYITDYKGCKLGMSNEEIDRLLEYRKQNKWINSAEQFQEVTQVSDSLLRVLSPYFKFPEWVLNKRSYSNKPKRFTVKQDLNTATVKELQKVSGVGEVLSKRIIRLRNSFPGGFVADVQLRDVYGLKPEVINNITEEFTVKTPRLVEKLNLNTATVDELVTIQHIDYDIANNIIEKRLLLEGYKSINELAKVKDFPINKIDIIKLYLHLEKDN